MGVSTEGIEEERVDEEGGRRIIKGEVEVMT